MVRLRIRVTGLVQGVGFRPFVYRLATAHRLTGFVLNDSGELRIEVEGDSNSTGAFLKDLKSDQPPLAQLNELCMEEIPVEGTAAFEIRESASDAASEVFVCPDIAACDECLREMFDSEDRRYHYPFLNCTNCGPRFTVIRSPPYDRERTTMSSFPMCPQCREEFEDPANRRFHAQPTACAVCGPELILTGPEGEVIKAVDPIAFAVEKLSDGAIAAVKGLGGFHLACEAQSQRATAELRRRKQRDAKPFAVMVRDLASAEALCEVTPAEWSLLCSRERPIVLLRRRENNGIAEAVAPGNPLLGVMLPYAPVHHLLLEKMSGPLVLTSGNYSDEPIVYRDAEVVSKLEPLADFILTNNREIAFRCDDSVVRVVGEYPILMRRSRGYAPANLTLPMQCARPMLALGGQQKNTFALMRGTEAILSHHIGDLDYTEAYGQYGEAITHYERLFDIEPEIVVHDLHPDYASTLHGIERTKKSGLNRVAVQHHHAHLASCMADNGITERVIGVTFDGTGLGTDGTIWGGDFLIGDFSHYTRAAHLRYVRMPGGAQAVREPWRMAVAHLLEAGIAPEQLFSAVEPKAVNVAKQLINRGASAPLTSSCGRLLDAVAAILGFHGRVSYEGQSAAELEWLAEQSDDDSPYPFALEGNEPIVIDTRPFIQAVAVDKQNGVPECIIARRTHFTLVAIILEVCSSLRRAARINAVALSGGVFMNGILVEQTASRLAKAGFRVFCHRRVPPNDGGLCLGQLAIAAALQASS